MSKYGYKKKRVSKIKLHGDIEGSTGKGTVKKVHYGQYPRKKKE